MPVKLEIIMNDNGTLTINGPIENPYMCYGIMELAKDVIRSRYMAQQVQAPGPRELLEFGRKGQ